VKGTKYIVINTIFANYYALMKNNIIFIILWSQCSIKCGWITPGNYLCIIKKSATSFVWNCWVLNLRFCVFRWSGC